MKNNYFRIIILTLLFLFMGLYFASNNGYVDYQAKNKMIMTTEEIKEFEEDVKNNRPIDVRKYVIDKEEKYDNKLSKIGLKLSNTIGSCFESAINFMFSKLEKAMK